MPDGCVPLVTIEFEAFRFARIALWPALRLLRQESQANGSPASYRNSSPFVATLLSFVPGLGAAYNGQTAKAIVHFAIFASFFQMAVLTQGVHFFMLGVLGTWLFAAVDACRTAQLIRAGLTPETEEDVITRRLYGNPFAWGLTLIVIGTLFLLHTLLGVQLAGSSIASRCTGRAGRLHAVRLRSRARFEQTNRSLRFPKAAAVCGCKYGN